MTRLRESWWPLGPAAVLVPSAAIVVVVVAMTWSRLWWPFPEWGQTSAQFHQQFAFAGMIAGTAACWCATVLHRHDRVWWQPRATRAGLPVVVRHVTALAGWFLGAYVLALLPLVVSTVGGIGSPEPLVMVSGLLAVVAVVALGYAFGVVVPHPGVVPVVAVGCYALLVAGNAGGERFASVSPVLHLEPALGEREAVPLVVFRVALFVVLAGAAAGLAASATRRAVTGTYRLVGLDVVAYLAVPALLITFSLVRQPVVFTADARPPASCTERRGVTYCVHAERGARLDDLVAVVDPVIARYGVAPDDLSQVRDYALTPRPAEGVEVAWLDPDGTIQADVALTLAGVYACEYDSVEEEREELPQAIYALSSDLYEFLVSGRTGGMLSGMSAGDVQRWLGRTQSRLHACALTPADLPGTR